MGSAWGVVGLSPDVPDQTTADGILTRLLTFTTAANLPTHLKTLLSTSVTVTGWRVELRGEDERILSVAEGNLATPFIGLQQATKTPQDAVVISLRTSTPGARGRGRMYWPAVGATIGASWQLTAPTTAQIAADARTWLNAIGTQMNDEYIAQASAKRVALSVRSPTDHVCRNVNQIQIGSVIDTQRRRRDEINETYSSVAYP